MKQEKILELMYQLGLQPELVSEDFGYRFDYEGLPIVWMNEDEDSNTITFMVPSVFEVTEENRMTVLEAALKLSSKLKFVQPNLNLDSVWLAYQHFLDGQEPTENLIEHMIRLLAIATIQFHNIINNEGDDD